MAAGAEDVRALLRSLPVFAVNLPEFDAGAVPDDPVTLFVRWLTEAIDAGVPEPHAMTLSTADDRGRPSSRVLICKNIDEAGRWYFASSSASRKGRELEVNPHAALSFYWPAQGRQIRVRGEVASAGSEASAADFLARAPGGRAEALIGRQSEPLADPADLDRAFSETQAAIAAEPGLVAAAWTLYAVTAAEVEFWQADRERRHIRLRYQRAGSAWSRHRLWP